MRYLALLVTALFLNIGCGPPTAPGDDGDDDGDDDSSDDDVTGDDDTSFPDPLAPVVSGFEISHGPSGNGCFVDIGWHVEDADGDLSEPSAFVAFGDTELQWNIQLVQEPPIFAYDFDLHIQVNAPDHTQLDAAGEYDVELWIVDDAGHESNRIGEVGWTAPTENCQ